MKSVYTTGQVAKLLHVAPRTVSKWFDAGRLGGYRIPGSQDRRIPKDALVAFLKENGMPQWQQIEDAAKFRILMIGLEPQLATQCNVGSDKVTVTHLQDMFEVGSFIATKTADVIVLDCYMGNRECRAALQTLRRAEALKHSIFVVLANEDTIEGFEGVDLVFKRPFPVETLSSKLCVYAERAAA